MMREVCFLIGTDGQVLYSDASSSPSSMPDSRQRWQAIWDRRDVLVEIAHSHPRGPAAFSSTDESTMSALSGALGRAPRYSVVTPVAMIVRVGERTETVNPEPWWADLLRLASGMAALQTEEE